MDKREKVGIFCKKRYKSKAKVSILSLKAIEMGSDLEHFPSLWGVQ